MNLRIWCPSCRQGWVYRKRAPGMAAFWVCEECEGTWIGSDVGPNPDELLEVYLETQGSTARYWNDLEDSPEQLIEPSSE
jgi:ribosomal protein L37AE/L43A